MDQNCVFCRIAAGEAESSVVLENDAVLAFMDVRAFHPGHTLVIPKGHIVDILAVDEGELARELMLTVAQVARAVKSAFAADGISVWQSNGKAAGQEVFHLHMHVVPRYEDDGLLKVYPALADTPARADLDEHAQRIRTALR